MSKIENCEILGSQVRGAEAPYTRTLAVLTTPDTHGVKNLAINLVVVPPKGISDVHSHPECEEYWIIGVEVRKVDSRGRFILPADWRESALKDTWEVYVIKRADYLKVIPKRRVDLTKFFDKVDLGVDAIRDWETFENPLAK